MRWTSAAVGVLLVLTLPASAAVAAPEPPMRFVPAHSGNYTVRPAAAAPSRSRVAT